MGASDQITCFANSKEFELVDLKKINLLANQNLGILKI